jgi:hypothetical protein
MVILNYFWLFLLFHLRLLLVILSYFWLIYVIFGYFLLCEVIVGYCWLLKATSFYNIIGNSKLL